MIIVDPFLDRGGEPRRLRQNSISKIGSIDRRLDEEVILQPKLADNIFNNAGVRRSRQSHYWHFRPLVTKAVEFLVLHNVSAREYGEKICS